LSTEALAKVDCHLGNTHLRQGFGGQVR